MGQRQRGIILDIRDGGHSLHRGLHRLGFLRDHGCASHGPAVLCDQMLDGGHVLLNGIP